MSGRSDMYEVPESEDESPRAPRLRRTRELIEREASPILGHMPSASPLMPGPGNPQQQSSVAQVVLPSAGGNLPFPDLPMAVRRMFIGQTVYSFDDWRWLLVVFQSSPQILRVDLQRLRDLLMGYGGAVRQYLVDFLNRPQQLPAPTMLVMTRPHRLESIVPASTYTLPDGVSNLHISRVQALYVQSYGVRNREECTRCASENADLVFFLCTSAEPFGQGACGNCLWQQNAQGCSREFFSSLFVVRTLC